MKDETYYSDIKFRVEEPVRFENGDYFDLDYRIV